jgi:GNAT superfamily N-acetyltransferase
MGPSARGLELDVLDHDGAREIFEELSLAHRTCFPGESSDAADPDAFFARAAWLHDERDAVWFVLRESDSGNGKRRVVGFACGFAYADSWYGAHLGVIPEFRKRGLGSYLMRVSQAHAGELGLTRLQASVEIDPKIGRGRLLRYYERHGARVRETGFGSAESVPASVVRIERVFTRAGAKSELTSSERSVFGSCEGRSRAHRITVLVGTILAVFATMNLIKRSSRVVRY